MMRKAYLIALLASLPMLTAAGIPNFFAGLIGDNVHTYCQKDTSEQQQLLRSVNRYTGNHQVVVVCGEVVAEATKADSRSQRKRFKR